MKPDLKSVASVRVGDFGTIADPFWSEKLGSASEPIVAYFQKKGSAVFAKLPISVQLEGSSRLIPLRLELSYALVCHGDDRAIVTAREVLYFELLDVTPGKIPIYENKKFAEALLANKFDTGWSVLLLYYPHFRPLS